MLYLADAEIELPTGAWLFIGERCDHPKMRVFDHSSSFNPLKDVDKKTARQIAKVPYLTTPDGANTLTVRNGRSALAPRPLECGRFDNVRATSRIKGVGEEVLEVVEDLLFTDVMRSVLCSDNDFGFERRNRKVFARLDRDDA